MVREDDLGSNLRTGPFKDSNLATLWSRVVETGDVSLVDFASYKPSGSKQAAFIGAPFRDYSGTILGVIALQMTPEFITTIMGSREGMGETGESYLLNWHEDTNIFELRSNLQTMGDGEYVVGYSLGKNLDYWVDAVKEGRAGGHNTYVDSKGNSVLVA